MAEELGLDNSNTPSLGNSFFATILQRLSYPGVGEETGEDGSGGGGGRGGKGAKTPGKQQAKGEKSGSKQQQGGGKGKKQASSGSINSGGGGKQKAAPAVQSYPVPAGDDGGAILRALVGRNSRQNDHVTFALAKPHELWFHAQGVPGAHVLLRFDPGAEVGWVGCFSLGIVQGVKSSWYLN